MTEIHTLVHVLREPGRTGQAQASRHFGFAVAPSFNGATTAKLHADTFSMLKTTKHPDEAFEALTALAASGELLDHLWRHAGRPGQQTHPSRRTEENYPGSTSTGPSRRRCSATPTSPTTSPGSRTMPRASAAWQAFGDSYRTTEGATSTPSSISCRTTLQGIFDEAAP